MSESKKLEAQRQAELEALRGRVAELEQAKAQHAAADEENSRLLERMQRQHAALVDLATHPALAEGRLVEALPIIAELAAETLAVERVNIWQLSPDGKELRCLAAFVRSTGQHASGDVLYSERYPQYFAALESGLVVDAADVSTDPQTAELTADYWQPLGIRSAIDAPIRVHGKQVAVICHEHVGPARAWTPDEITFASQVAALVAQTFLNADVRRRTEELAALHSTSLDITTRHELPSLLHAVVQRAARLLGAHMGALLLVKPDGETLELVAGHNQPDHFLGATLRFGEGLAGRIAQSGEPIVIADYGRWAGRSRPLAAGPIGRILGVPLKQENRVIGVLNVFDEKPGAFSQEEVQLLSLFATQAAIAIKKAHLHQEVQKQARQVRQILDTVQDGILLLDAEHRVKLANPAAQTYLKLLAGVETGAVLTHLGEQLLAEILTARSSHHWREVTIVGSPDRVFEVMARPIEAELEAEGWVIVLRDVTEERDRQKRVQQQERLVAVGQLAAGIAHDFNNILTSIMGYAELARRDPNLPDVTRRDMERIVHQAQRAAYLVRQILDFSRQSIIEKRPLDLAPFLKEASKVLKRTIPENVHIALKTDPSDNGYVLAADPTQLQQVITNLAVNARDAMPAGGTLQLHLSRLRLEPGQETPCPEMPMSSQGSGPTDWIVWSVSDTGVGIPFEMLPRIFEPFFTTKEVGQGTGLGLAQVYGIIRQHGGCVDVVSHAGQGTTFTLYLPALSSEPLPPGDVPLVEVPRGQGEVILLVEDEPLVLEVAKAMLNYLNYEVLVATNGREALTIYDRQRDRIALVLTDVTMPEMGGGALARALHKSGATVNVVALTGYPLHGETKDLLAQGFVDWLQKPLNLGQLAQAVHRSLK